MLNSFITCFLVIAVIVCIHLLPSILHSFPVRHDISLAEQEGLLIEGSSRTRGDKLMNATNADRELIDWVQREINSGSRHIVLPGRLVSATSESTLEEIRRLCKLNRVRVDIRT